MLLPREQGAWNCGYYLGAKALQALREMPDQRCDLLELQKRMSELSDRELSITQVVSAAAWLYLIDAVEADGDGAVALCK